MMRILRSVLVLSLLLPVLPVKAACCLAESGQKTVSLAASCDCCHGHACLSSQQACEVEVRSEAAVESASASFIERLSDSAASLVDQWLDLTPSASQGLAPPRLPFLHTAALCALILPLRL